MSSSSSSSKAVDRAKSQQLLNTVALRVGVVKPAISPPSKGEESPIVVTPTAKGEAPSKEIGFSKEFLRGHLMNRKGIRYSKGAAGHIAGARIVTIPVPTGPQDATTTAGGLFTGGVNYASLQSNADFIALAALFDVNRVAAIDIHYQPRAPCGTFVAAGAAPVHAPCLWQYAPDDLSAAGYTQMSQNMDMTDHKNFVITNTGYAKSHRFEMPGAKTSIGSNSSVYSPTMGQWMNEGIATVGGFVQISTRTDALNVSLVYGTFFYTWVIQFAWRV